MLSRSVVVTGGNRGIGLGIARAFVKAGDKVAITYRTGAPPDGLFGVRCDVRDAESVRTAFEEARVQHGPIQVLVSNAGITRDALLLGMKDQDLYDVFETNLLGAFRCVKEAAMDMVTARWGRIILISSTTAMAGARGQTSYAATKAGLLGMARALSWELGPRKITVNVVAPGFIETDMTSDVSDETRQIGTVRVPLRRGGTVDEVSGIVRFIASDEASYMTGAFIPVGGGLGMGH
jgi:3-oxoacyl-[acyl-carrier protein] reductase